MSDTGSVDPNFVPQMFWVEVIPGFEDCHFKITSSKNTIPLVEIFTAHPENKPEQDLTPSNLMLSNSEEEGLPPMGSSFGARFRLKQGTMHRFRISTYDTSNGEAEAFGTFTTKSRKAIATLDKVVVFDSGDPGRTGEVFMRFGLFKKDRIGWSPITGKSTEIGAVTWGIGDLEALPNIGTPLFGSDFSASYISGEDVPDFLRVVFYAKDHDEPFTLSLWGAHYQDAKDYGGNEGRDPDGQPVESAQGDDQGEWVRLVQDFPNIPSTPGSYNFPIKLTSSWGIVCDVYASLTVTVTQGPQPTVLYQREGP
jgi:hypothetical protein